jgi:5-methylcytosine-specific restriction endonuclease McrA
MKGTLLRDGYGCEVCYHDETMSSVVERAGVTDHIVPISEGGAMWDERNHMAMCQFHHNQKRGHESHGLRIGLSNGLNGLIPSDRLEVVRMLLRVPSEGEGGDGL